MTDDRSVHPPPPRPIAFLITELEPGGAERNLVELATRIDRSRFAASVYSIAPPPSRDHLVQMLTAADIPWTCLGCTRPSQVRTAIRKLSNCFRKEEPALLQTFLFHANVVGAAVAKRLGAFPLVTGIRVAERRGWWRRIVERRAARIARYHVCVSDDVADYCASTVRLSEDKLVVIPNGIEVSRFESARPVSPGSLGFADGRKLLACVGRIDRQKRVDRVVECFRIIRDQLPGHDLLIVGDGPQRRAVERQVRTAGLTDRVRIVGWRDDVASLLKATDLLLLASAWEGMPNIVLEAMASATAVVAFDVEGVAQLLGDQGVEQIVRRADFHGEAEGVEQFARQVLWIAGQEDLKARIGKANQQRALEVFSLPQTVGKYEELYGSMLG